MKTELIRDMPRDEYDRLQRVNWSTLRELLRSPAHYRHVLLNRKKDTTPLKLGRAAHIATLEPERFLSEHIVWEGGVRRGKAWDAFCKKHAGLEILTEAEADYCRDIQVAARNHPDAARYLSGGIAEPTLCWSQDGMELKARPDFIADAGAIVDLKTTRNASPEAFGKAVWNYRYHSQAAMYSDGYAAVTGTRLPFVFVAVETEPPHIVQVYRVPDFILELGREEYRGLLERLGECRKESRWPGYCDGEAELSLPKWAVRFDEEEDLSALDLVIGQQEV